MNRYHVIKSEISGYWDVVDSDISRHDENGKRKDVLSVRVCSPYPSKREAEENAREMNYEAEKTWDDPFPSDEAAYR